MLVSIGIVTKTSVFRRDLLTKSSVNNRKRAGCGISGTVSDIHPLLYKYLVTSTRYLSVNPSGKMLFDTSIFGHRDDTIAVIYLVLFPNRQSRTSSDPLTSDTL